MIEIMNGNVAQAHKIPFESSKFSIIGILIIGQMFNEEYVDCCSGEKRIC